MSELPSPHKCARIADYCVSLVEEERTVELLVLLKSLEKWQLIGMVGYLAGMVSEIPDLEEEG